MCVLVVEDEVSLARTYARIFSDRQVLISNCVSGATAIIRRRSPWLSGVIVDIGLPDGTGFAVLESFRSAYPLGPALVVTSTCRAEYINRAFRYQAGFVVKPFCLPNLQRFAEQMREADELDGRTVVDDMAARYDLSPRESALLAEAVSGVPRGHLADTLGVSENTVKSQIRSLLLKTGHRTLAEAVWELHSEERSTA